MNNNLNCSVIIEGCLENGSRKENSFEFTVVNSCKCSFDMVCWGKLTDTCEKEFEKGRNVRVAGIPMQNRWRDTNGKLHSSIVIAAEFIEFNEVNNTR